MLWVRLPLRARCTTLCDKDCQRLAAGWWFSPGPLVSSTNKTVCHDITETLLKVALNTIKKNPQKSKKQKRRFSTACSNFICGCQYCMLRNNASLTNRINNTLHSKLNIEQHELHLSPLVETYICATLNKIHCIKTETGRKCSPMT